MIVYRPKPRRLTFQESVGEISKYEWMQHYW